MPTYHFMVGRHVTMEPFKRIKVTAIDTISGKRTTVRTDLNGIAKVTTSNEARLVVHTYEPYELLSLSALGVNVDYIVASDGTGTHTALYGTSGALDAAIATGVDQTIWLCTTHVEAINSQHSLPALAANQRITVLSAGRNKPVLSVGVGATAMIAVGGSSLSGVGSSLRFQGFAFKRTDASAGSLFEVSGGGILPGIGLVDIGFETGSSGWTYLLDTNTTGSGQVRSFAVEKLSVDTTLTAVATSTLTSASTSSFRVLDSHFAQLTHFIESGSSTEMGATGIGILNNTVTLMKGYALPRRFNYPLLMDANIISNMDAAVDWLDLGSGGSLGIHDAVITDNYLKCTAAGASAFHIPSPSFGSVNAISITGNTLVGPDSGTAIKVDPVVNGCLILNAYRGWTNNVVYSGGGSPGFGGDHSLLSNLDVDDHPHYGQLATAESVTGLWNFIASGLGGLTDYDVTVGDVTTPDYGLVRIGDSSFGRTSYNVASLDLDGTVISRNIGGPVTGQIEFVWVESAGSSVVRFALPKSGVGNATYNPRSMLIAGPAVNDDDVVTVGYWQSTNSIFHNLACDTAVSGADLGVQNDLEVEGDIFTDSLKESTPGAGITIGSGNVHFPDNASLYFGTGDDASILYDATNLIVNPQLVGIGTVRFEFGTDPHVMIFAPTAFSHSVESLPAVYTVATFDDPAAGSFSSFFLLQRAGGTIATPTNVLSGWSLGKFGWTGYGDGAFRTSAYFEAFSREDFDIDDDHGTDIDVFVTKLLAANPTRLARFREDYLMIDKIWELTSGAGLQLDNFLEVPEVAAPSTPAAGFMRVYGKSDNKLYLLDDAGVETDLTAGAVGSIGPMGPPGVDGEPGEAGLEGSAGAQGASGATGSTGATGATGSQGTPGMDGEDGAEGAQGPQGVAGDTGATGATGDTGATGATGVAGLQGPPGVDGEEGAQGPSGDTGATGAAGAAGVDGLQGPPGVDGEQGESGPPGLLSTPHLYRYLNVPDAGPGDVLTTIATAQGVYHHSGPVAEKAEKLYVDAKTAPGASGLPCTWSYGDTNDLDTVASWTTIATLTLSSEMSSSTETMTNVVVPANRLMRVIWGTIVGSPTDAQTVLVTRPVA